MVRNEQLCRKKFVEQTEIILTCAAVSCERGKKLVKNDKEKCGYNIIGFSGDSKDEYSFSWFVL